MELPTLLQMNRLEPTSATRTAPERGWGLRHRLAFLGSVLLAAGLLMAAALYWALPDPPTIAKTPEAIRSRAESLSLLESVREWIDLADGLDSRPPPAERLYREARESTRRWFYVAGALAVAGLAVIAAAAVRPGRPTS